MKLFFFFSSRRRHTRWNCDWSSDVCSSDLIRRCKELSGELQERSSARDPRRTNRSEERRVGKECRSRWAAYHEKKKRVLGVVAWAILCRSVDHLASRSFSAHSDTHMHMCQS